jgi:protein-export membrane protein SecD
MRAGIAAIIIVLSGFLSWFVFSTNHVDSAFKIRLGLDLAGGTELIYQADAENASDTAGALASLRDVIERRINVFGVAEPLIQVERASSISGVPEDRLLVELPGVTDVKAAVDAIGETPLLEFKLAKTSEEGEPAFLDTGLTGRYVKKADLQFGATAGAGLANEPIVVLSFDEEGATLFEELTRENVGEVLAIFLDGVPISTPVIREAISGGQATISGQFTPEEARDLVRNLNFGALPVPITLISSNTVGPTLGGEAFSAGLLASVAGFMLVALFMIVWYRFQGFAATIALLVYIVITIALIKVVPITLTASGIAALILSIGMAVDANVLIFERMKEELRRGLSPREAAKIGFSRAWPAIRDGHFTMIISSIILFWMGTSLVQGFALVFGLGVIISLLSAITITQAFLNALLPEKREGAWKFLLSTGIHSH